METLPEFDVTVIQVKAPVRQLAVYFDMNEKTGVFTLAPIKGFKLFKLRFCNFLAWCLFYWAEFKEKIFHSHLLVW